MATQPDRRKPDRRIEAWKAFLLAHRVVLDRLEKELRREQGLPLTWYDVLATLSRSPNRRLRMNELADSVLLTQSGLTRLVDRMESEGLVERQACPSDRRGAEVVLTPAGKSKLARSSRTHLQGVHEHFTRHLSDSEADTLRRCLEKMAT